MILPSGREVSNLVLADAADRWALRALESEESLPNWEATVLDDLVSEQSDGTEGFSNEDAKFIIEEIFPTTVSYFSELREMYGKLYEKHIASKYLIKTGGE